MKRSSRAPAVRSAESRARDWLDQFAAAVRAEDYAAGQALFDPAVMAFGSVVPEARNLRLLEKNQWRLVWPATRNFRFHRVRLGFEGSICWVTAQWSSRQRGPAGRLRRGRATLILRKSGATFRAVHSHFSLLPEVRP